MSGSVYFTVRSNDFQPLQTSPNDPSSSKKILNVLKIYEAKYEIFSALSLHDVEILEKINCILMEQLNIDIKNVFETDYQSFIMIISAFYGRREALVIPGDVEVTRDIIETLNEEDYLSECSHPLHTVMVMCLATYQMQKILMKDDFGQNLRMEKYELLNRELEELGCKLINHLYVESPLLSKQALQVDFRIEPNLSVEGKGYSQYLHRKFDQSREIMAVAYKAKAMKFLSQRPCMNLMKIRKVCRKKSSNDCVNHSMRGASLMEQTAKKTPRFRPTIVEKLIFHSIFRMLYILMFAYMLCRYPYYDDYDSMKLHEFIPFFYVFSVLITQFLMTLVKSNDYRMFHLKKLQLRLGRNSFLPNLKLSGKLLHRYFHSNKLAFYRMFMVFSVAILEVVRFFCFLMNRSHKNLQDRIFWHSGWPVVPISLELLYCVLFSIAVVSSLKLLHFVSALGFFVHLFKKMWKTVGMFILIFCTFWAVLAVIHVSLSRTVAHSKSTILHTVVAEGKFEIFGEVKDEDRNGHLINCDHFNRTVSDFFDMHYAEASCLFRSSVLPFLVFGYMFVTGILLVNLLTAQLTKEYEKESENSRYYKGFLRYEQLSKIESKLYLPPPLSLVYVLLRVGSFYSNWMLVNVVEHMEGYPWGSVRDVESDASKEAEENIKAFLTKGPKDVYHDLKDVVSKYIREGVKVDAKALEEIKKDMNDLLENAIKDEAQASRARSRAPTRMENEDDPSIEVPIRMSSSFSSFS